MIYNSWQIFPMWLHEWRAPARLILIIFFFIFLFSRELNKGDKAKIYIEGDLFPGHPFKGLKSSVRYHFERVRILTLYQDLWGKGQS